MAISTQSFLPPLNLNARGAPEREVEMLPFPCTEPIPLPRRFTVLKESLASGVEAPLVSSWTRLLTKLQEEIAQVSSLGSQVVPIISFADISNPESAERFVAELRKTGVAIIRNVLPRETALGLGQDTTEYLDQNSWPKASSTSNQQLFETYWSPAQITARAHPNVLAAQRFAMKAWRSRDTRTRITTNFPVTYADRVRIWTGASGRTTPDANVDGGSVERWEPDGYGRAGTYREIFEGRWEDYDPWESDTRVGVTSDLYRGAGSCSIFRMFQGWLALGDIPPDGSTLQVCPMPQLATAYYLLRPFFSPSTSPKDGGGGGSSDDDDDNDDTSTGWGLNSPQNSILHGALPSYAQTVSPSLHPHLELNRSLISIPHLEPGDYVLWHPDLVHVVDGRPCNTSNINTKPKQATFQSTTTTPAIAMYLPACPLTQTNALYLSRQRKSFLLGRPGPDFFTGSGGSGGSHGGHGGYGHVRGQSSSSSGEVHHAGRAGVQDVNDAGGNDGLRCMGLLPWDEEDAWTDAEREVLAMANGILFPDLYDMI